MPRRLGVSRRWKMPGASGQVHCSPSLLAAPQRARYEQVLGEVRRGLSATCRAMPQRHECEVLACQMAWTEAVEVQGV